MLAGVGVLGEDWCAFAPKARVDKKGSAKPFPGTVCRHIADYTMQVTRAHAEEVGGRRAIAVGEHFVVRVPAGKTCSAFRAKAIFPGYKCKSICNQFPCVACGSEKELAIRDAFKGVPEVAEYIRARWG